MTTTMKTTSISELETKPTTTMEHHHHNRPLSGRVLSQMVGELAVTLLDPLYVEELEQHDEPENDCTNSKHAVQVKVQQQEQQQTQQSSALSSSSSFLPTHLPEYRLVQDKFYKQHQQSKFKQQQRKQPLLHRNEAELRDDTDTDDDCRPSRVGGYCSTTDEETTANHNDDENEQQQQIEEEIILPEDPFDLEECPRILTQDTMRELRDALPDALKGNKWERCFAIGRDGDSMITMLQLSSSYHYTILVAQDSHGRIVGGFCTEPWRTASSAVIAEGSTFSSPSSSGMQSNGLRQRQLRRRRASYAGGGSSFSQQARRPSTGYYGTGQSFLFASHPDIQPGIDAPREERDPTKQFVIYKWTGDNDYCQIIKENNHSPFGSSGLGSDTQLAMGGKGGFGLIIHDNFVLGETERCATFGNPPLVPSGQLDMVAFELYGMVPIFAMPSTYTLSSASSSSSLIKPSRSRSSESLLPYINNNHDSDNKNKKTTITRNKRRNVINSNYKNNESKNDEERLIGETTTKAASEHRCNFVF